MNELFIEKLKENFNGKFVVKSNDESTYIEFPEKSNEFGNIEIYEEYPGGYIVIVGKFTHTHFDYYEGSEEEITIKIADDISEFLEEVFSDKIICYGSHLGGGGWFTADHCRAIDCEKFVWSGKYKG